MEASGVGAIRQRPQPNSGAQDQQKGLLTAAAKWRLTTGIGFSRSKQTSIHKPLRPRACSSTSTPSAPSARTLTTRASPKPSKSSKRTSVADAIKRQKAAVDQASDDHPRPRSILDPAPAVALGLQEPPSVLPPNAVTTKPEKGVTAAPARGGRPSAGGADLILIGGRFGSTALPRSGSAPPSSATTLTKYPTNSCGSADVQREKSRVPAVGGIKRPGGLEPGPSPAPTTLSCWDESGDANNAPAEATVTLPPRHGAARSWDGQVGNATATQNDDKDVLPQWTAGASGAGWKDAPLASQHDEPLAKPLGKSAGKRKHLLSPLRRRKSDVTDSKRVHTARAEAASAAPKTARAGRRSSDSTLQTPQLSQASSGRLLRSDIAPGVVRAGQKPLEARQGVSIKNLSVSRPSTHAGRWGASSGRLLRSQADADERVGQGQLKARTRVMEWKRRQSDGIKAKVEEVATLEQKERAEAALEAARKLAATRAEEAERRLVAEREDAAGVGRAADLAEKWAKHSLERRRRRAEIYAINAIMRAAFEKDFKAYSLEKERQAQEPSPMAS